MSDKTRAKIEAMKRIAWHRHIDDSKALTVCSSASMKKLAALDSYNYRFPRGFECGATPWAERCEMFSKDIQSILDMTDNYKRTEIRRILLDLMSDYNSWLEDVDGEV